MDYKKIILLYFLLLALPLRTIAAQTPTELSVWVNEAIVATYTYNYQNELTRQKEIAHYFTSTGWINYTKALTESKLPTAVKKNAYSVSAVATMPPIIKSLHQNYWQAMMPVLVVY